jgi:hypothetical protein
LRARRGYRSRSQKRWSSRASNQCGNRVAGGILTVTAKDIEDPSYSKLTVRVTYRDRDGDRIGFAGLGFMTYRKRFVTPKAFTQ